MEILLCQRCEERPDWLKKKESSKEGQKVFIPGTGWQVLCSDHNPWVPTFSDGTPKPSNEVILGPAAPGQ